MVDPGGTEFTAPWMLVNCTTFATQVPTATTDAVNCWTLRPAKMTIVAASTALRHTTVVVITRPPLYTVVKNTTGAYLVTVQNCSVIKISQGRCAPSGR